jgi:hypothetical protein
MRILIALWFLVALVRAADLTADLTPLVPQSRPAAPEWVEVKLTKRGSGLREGALEFEMRGDGATLYRYRTHDLALTAGTQRFRFLLPAASFTYPPVVRHWRLRFLERDRSIDLGDFASPPRMNAARSLVLGVVRGTGGGTPGWQALRLERFAPAPTDQIGRASFSTTPLFLDPDDLPVDPLGYCAFDALLLDGDALSRLREKSRTALARWIHAGGSLAVIAPTGLDDTHLAFLNELGAPDSRWREVTQPLTGVMTARANFGRLVVAADPPPEELPAEWRHAAGFLWKLRAAPLRTLARAPQWAESDIDRSRRDWGDFSAGNSLSDLLISALMPEGIRPLPIRVLWGIALGFLVAIGPLEWWVLGALRRRRLTWVVFPCVAFGFTALTVALARGYLGSSLQRGELIITDLGADGHAVRQTRIELTLPAREGDLVTDAEHALFVSIGTRTDRDSTSPAQFAGQFPARYRTLLEGRQWSPVLTRSTSFAPREDDSGLTWHAPTKTLPAGFAATVRGKSRAVLDIFCHGRQRSSESGVIDLEWRKNMVIAQRTGAFATLASAAPTGSPFLEDLACLDNDSDDTSIILAATREGSTIRIWRHIFLH